MEAICESLHPANRLARTDVGACMTEVLVNAGGTSVLFDGHITDPHFYPALQRIPDVTGRTLELLEIPAAPPLPAMGETKLLAPFRGPKRPAS